MKILYLIDPNSIHDQKWISRFIHDKKNRCYFICREHHFTNDIIVTFQRDYNILFLGTIDYFSFKKIGKSIRQIVKIRRMINDNNIQLFHIQYAEPNALWALFRKYLGIPILITCRGTDVLKTIPDHFSKRDPFNKLISWSYKKAFQWADWVTVTSSGQLKSVKNFSGRKDGITIVRTGVDVERLFKDTSSYFPDGINKPYLLFPRYIKPIYNHEFAIEAIKLLPAEIKMKFQMVFVGKDSGDLDYQKKLIEILDSDQLVDYIILTKQKQEAIWELYKRAEVIVMTPKSDGSPVSGMEAIALRKKLVLGPLDYDEDIFNRNSCMRLQKWDLTDLTKLILNTLATNVTNEKSYNENLDFNVNMKIVNSIYLKLTA